nr:vegetative cell wall protein gp1 precursor [uncultured bacterium]
MKTMIRWSFVVTAAITIVLGASAAPFTKLAPVKPEPAPQPEAVPPPVENPAVAAPVSPPPVAESPPVDAANTGEINAVASPAIPLAGAPMPGAQAAGPPSAASAPSALPFGGNMPAITLPPGAAPPSAPAGGGQAAPKEDPNLEFTAIEASSTGQAGPLSDELKPFKPVLDKLKAGDTYRIVSQEAKVAPYSKETQWTITPQYDAFVLPMDQTPEGAVRLDARVAVNSGGKSLNALRAEGEIPQRKVMVFRGLEGDNGHELLLMLRLKQDDDGGESSSSSDENEDQQDQKDAKEQNAQQAKEDKEQQEEKEAKEKEEKEKQDQEQKMAQKADEKQDNEDENAAPKDGQNIEALLNSLVEQDQRQQAEAQFDRKVIKLPPSGEWW